MGQSFSPGWDDVRDCLNHDIEVYYTKNEDTNRVREFDKRRAVDWLIERMRMGTKPGGTRLLAPVYVQFFGASTWKAVKNAMILYHPHCYICDRPAEEVHHVWARYLGGSEIDPCNLVCLCRECHDQVHRNLDEGIRRAINESIRIKTASPTSLEAFE